MAKLATFETFKHAENFCSVFRENGDALLYITRVSAQCFEVYLVAGAS